MSMFQPQNYGADFVNSMSATAGMLNDRRKLDMAEKQQAEQEKRYAAEAETRTLQNEGLRKDNALKAAKVDQDKLLQGYLQKSARWATKELKPEDYGKFEEETAQIMKLAPNLPSDPDQIPQYLKATGNLLSSIDQIRTLPAGNYQYTRADNVPQINAALDDFTTLLSKERLGKEFVDADGSVTGVKGGKYKTADVGGFQMVSGEGNKAGFVPMFSVVGEDGKPIMRPDGRQAMVPSTVNQTNDPNDKLKIITPEELQVRAGFAYKVLNDAQNLGLSDPEKRQKYFADNLPLYMGEEGAKEILKRNTPKEQKLYALSEGQSLADGTGKIVVAGTPKPKEPKAPVNLFGEEVRGADLARQFPEAKGLKPNGFYRVTRDGDRMLFAEARPPKYAGEGGGSSGGTGGGSKVGSKGGSKGNLKEVIDEWQALNVKRNAQYAKDNQELRRVNATRAQNFEPPLTMKELFQSEESPEHEALTANMYRLRDVARDSFGYDLVNMREVGKATPAKGMKQTAPPPKKTQLAKNDTRPPLSAFMKRKP